MATMNPFDLLGDDDAEDPSQLIAAHQPKPAAAAASASAVGSQSKKPGQSKPAAVAAQPAAKLPSKPLPPAVAGLSLSIRRRFGSFDCFLHFLYI